MKVIKDKKEYQVVDEYEWFWNIFQDGTWEPNTFKIFDRFLDANKAYVDIGAWIGPTVLYGAGKAKEVYAFEPDPVAYEMLEKNIAYNGLLNVWSARLGVWGKWGKISLGRKTGFGDSMSSNLWKEYALNISVISFNTILRGTNPNFIKIDIEGGESNLLEHARGILKTYKPTIYLSLHTPWFEGEDLRRYKEIIINSLADYPRILNEKLEEINIEDAFDANLFTALVATYEME